MSGRTFHTDSRTWSNFQPSELVKLCGVSMGRWPVYVAKELLDNAVAALEETGKKAPMIRVTLTDDYIEVLDNGPGISDNILDKILDFDRFGGSNRHHKLPTRGAQGNAIMTIVGIASAWDAGYIELRRPCGPALSLKVKLDKVRQEVDIERTIIEDDTSPSSIRVPIPELPWKTNGADLDAVERVIRQFAWMNPHITFMMNLNGNRWAVPMDPSSREALKNNLQCGAAAWFTTVEFQERLSADIRARPKTRLADWLKEFGFGLFRPSDVMEDLGGNPTIDEVDVADRSTELHRFAVENSSDKWYSEPRFESVGGERLAEFLSKERGADSTSPFEYHALKGTFGEGLTKVPYLVEVCLVQMPSGSRYGSTPILAMNRTILYGSPTFKKIKWREKVRGQWRTLNGDLGALVRAYQIDHGKTPCATVVHVTCPSPGYSGYGKQQFDTTWLAEDLGTCYERVTLPARRQRAGEARRKNANWVKPPPIRNKMFDLIPSVYKEATANPKKPKEPYPILIRQFYYAFRKEWYTTDDRMLHYGTFCAYMSEYEQQIGRAICLKDPRGTVYEPHSGKNIRLGTSEVAAFKPKKWEGHTIIFVEKENLASLMKTMRIGKRWDAIIIGSKGFAVESCREVLQKYKKLLGDMVKIVALHDADPAGYMIGYDLATNLPRFGENVDVQVIDAGLTIEDANNMGLQDEPFDLNRQTWSMVTKTMRRSMIKDPDGTRRPLLDEPAYDAFVPNMYRGDKYPDWINKPKGRRVELNAMPPAAFEEWVENILEVNGCKKVRPPDAIVNETLRGARENSIKREAGEMFMRLMGDDVVMEVMKEIGVPAYDLDTVLAGRPEVHWEYLVKRAGDTGQDVGAAVERVMKRRMPGAFNG